MTKKEHFDPINGVRITDGIKKWKGFEREDGSLVDTAYLNGYCVGDTLLEDVMFEIKITEVGAMAVQPTEESGQYMTSQKISIMSWTDEVLKFALQNDVFCSTKDCTGEDLVLLPKD